MWTASSNVIFICLAFAVVPPARSVKFGYVDVKDIIKFGHTIMLEAFETLELIRPMQPEYDNSLPYFNRMERQLKSRISLVSQKIDSFQQQMNVQLSTVVAKLLNDLPERERLNQKLLTINQIVGQINDLYSIFETYSTAPHLYEKYTIVDFAETCVSTRSGAVPDLLKSLHRLFVPSPDEVLSRSVIILLANTMQEANSQICNENQSQQQLLYNLYSTVTLAEIKGYSMIQFSYNMLRLYNPGTNFTEEMKTVKKQYAIRTLETLRAVKTAMSFAPRQIWRCDAEEPKLDETYIKFKQLFQGYIVNEVDLNTYGTCKENCAYYEYTKVYGCFKNGFCAQQRPCKGRVLKCEYIDSDMWVCPAPEHSDRRYDYVQYENGRVFGQKKSCSRNVPKVNSWWRWLFWHCSYCFCYCDDNTPSSERYFSLRQVVSDARRNKVVTGVRFKKVNQIVHIQIQEGELMPRGVIDSVSVQWKPIEEFSIIDSNVKSGVDYHALSWEKRGLDLDDLIHEKDHILIGLRFRMVGPRLNLEVKLAEFNFTTGQLIDPENKSFWHSEDQTNRTELQLNDPDVPTNSPLLNLPDSKQYQYLNFAPSSREHDAAQNTVPFIDIQPVEPNPPVPIAGAGIYHKGRRNSGGYVALRLITYDFSQHLTVNLPPNTNPVVNNLNDMTVV